MMWRRRNKNGDSELRKALSNSARKLEETKAKEAELEPRFRRIEKALKENHIHEAIVRSFRVAR